MPSSFCRTCTAILSSTSLALEDFDPEGFEVLKSTSHSFENSARQGCRLCLLFVSNFGERMARIRHLEFENLSLSEEKKHATIYTLFSYGNNHLLLEVSHQSPGEERLGRKRESVIRPAHSSIMLLSPESCKPEPLLFSLPIDLPAFEEHTGSETCLNLAKLWLNQCKSHPACQYQNKNSNTAFAVPTRLLHLGSLVSPSLRLCSGVPDGTSYASLSHCWGKHVPVKLLSSTLTEFQTKIEMPELPKTFRESIDFIRRLGLEYIWIDSLCIIQDSAEDWAHEAALMHQVYSNAIVNIAADDAIDGTEGLFRARDVRLCEPCEVEVNWTKQHRGAYIAVDNTLWKSNMENSVLNGRAWVLQEQLLSPRILHFGQTQLLWECQTGKACELFPEGLYEGHEGYGPKSMISKVEYELHEFPDEYGDTKDERVMVEFSQQYQAHQQWKEIVDNYTSRHLTFGSDKLVAISALAHRFQTENLGSEYLAGLWSQDLAAQLLWTTARLQLRDKATTRQTEYRAPTWSWASIDGRIHPSTPYLYPGRFQTHFKVHSAETTCVASANQFGSVSSGQIVVSGRIVLVSLISEPNHREGTASYHLQVHSSSGMLIPRGTLSGEIELATKDCTYEDGQKVLDVYKDIYFIECIDHYDGGQRGRGRAGILLQRKNVTATTFERFGRYNFHFDDMTIFEEGFRYFNSLAGENGFEFYEDEVSHHNMYKITIV
ncbi:heterokaryon incompatibility protein-domain-containing protein [Halenospora varia]|nr:heterokaryon incompatibility protein-domain-containing protein [Halenospora varia]